MKRFVQEAMDEALKLEEPLNRYTVRYVFHGHAHHGALEGKTSAGTTVYNVALPLLLRAFPNQPPLRFVTLPPAPQNG